MINWKGYGGKRPLPNLRYYPGICLEGLRKTMKCLNHNCLSPGRYFNPEVPPRTKQSATQLAAIMVF
jgi:hypothetical protein